MNFNLRKRRAAAAAKNVGVDAMLVTHLQDVRYLCGFTGSAGILAFAGQKAAFFTDGRYVEQARTEVKGVKRIVTKKPAVEEAVEWLREDRH